MKTIILFVILFGGLGYALGEWIIPIITLNQHWFENYPLMDMLLSPFLLGPLGGLVGYLYNRRNKDKVKHGLTQMLISTFFHLARADGAVTPQELRSIRVSILYFVQLLLPWTQRAAVESILNESEIAHQCRITNETEGELSSMARGALVSTFAQLELQINREMIHALVDIAKSDGPINELERTWLHAYMMLVHMDIDPAMVKLIAPVAA